MVVGTVAVTNRKAQRPCWNMHGELIPITGSLWRCRHKGPDCGVEFTFVCDPEPRGNWPGASPVGVLCFAVGCFSGAVLPGVTVVLRDETPSPLLRNCEECTDGNTSRNPPRMLAAMTRQTTATINHCCFIPGPRFTAKEGLLPVK